ncbi:MAG: hypothetical protein ACK5JI_09840, partial [Azonexus sp.]
CFTRPNRAAATAAWRIKEILNQSNPFGLSLSKPLILQMMPFDKLRANGFVQSFFKRSVLPSFPRAGVRNGGLPQSWQKKASGACPVSR